MQLDWDTGHHIEKLAFRDIYYSLYYTQCPFTVEKQRHKRVNDHVHLFLEDLPDHAIHNFRSSAWKNWDLSRNMVYLLLWDRLMEPKEHSDKSHGVAHESHARYQTDVSFCYQSKDFTKA
jgi:hypothetical protein